MSNVKPHETLMTDAEFDEYLRQAVGELEAKQSALEIEYDLGHHERFVVDYEANSLIFFAGEAPKVEARILPVATHVPAKKSLKWSWANSQLPQSVREWAAKVKELHTFTGLAMFATDAVECDESMAWEITALAAKYLSAMGAYRVPHRTLCAYVLITELRRVA
jgi:hypothetical protein